jgi:2-oxoglutarate ferredoxin oxidoreductase subunit beta
MANRDLIYLGVSGDGDTASIGMGQFTHAARRNLNMVYIVMNNGCYGLTKGQDSATADEGSKSKKGDTNPFDSIDLCALSLQLGATFVARSFSGDKDQLVPLIKAAMSHKGFALIDVLSPCVTFNNNPGSSKSYEFVRDHIEPMGTMDFVPMKDEITAQYEAGSTHEVTLHDGSVIHLHKMAEGTNPLDRTMALTSMEEGKAKGHIQTGLLYMDPDSEELHEMIGTVHRPLNQLAEKELCPGTTVLENINQSLR